jgi:hypothetical protein
VMVGFLGGVGDEGDVGVDEYSLIRVVGRFRMVEVSRRICVRKADLPVKLADIVPHLTWLQLGFIHSGRQFVLSPKGESRECIYTNLGESDECNLPITQQSIEHHFFYYGWKADKRYCRS